MAQAWAQADFSELFATLCLALGILHTFSVKQFQHWARNYPEGSVGENFFHLLGEVEVVFGLWASLFLLGLGLNKGSADSIKYLEGQNFTEPAFVFVILTVCSSRPILEFAELCIQRFSQVLPVQRSLAFYLSGLIVGPLLGSLITEPAAMTVTALILLDRLYSKSGTKSVSKSLKYATLGLLFVNVSLGGMLTSFAAPPVIMVAQRWGWDSSYMFLHFGWRAALAITLSSSLVCFRFRREIQKLSLDSSVRRAKRRIPAWATALHLLLLFGVIANAHSMVAFMGVFLFFLALANVTREYQSELKLREGLLVAAFLGGLVVLGGQQRWWLEPLLTSLQALPLYIGSIGLTAVTDNAALTYLGSQVPGLSEISKHALVAGACVGGGLTVIANAPNPAGYGILNSSFGKEGISPWLLFTNALWPTLIAALCLW